MSRTVLLTGATGFLGSHVLPALLARGHRVVVLIRSSSKTDRIAACLDDVVLVDIDAAPLEQVMATHGIDTVVHLACEQGRGSSDIAALLAVNLTLGIQLLQAARSSGVRYFINADTLLDAGVNAYALSKKQFSAWLPYFSTAMAIANLRLGNIYGPGEPASGFLSWLLQEFARRADRVELTEGAQLRDFVHVADVSAAILAVLDRGGETGLAAYDIGSGEMLSVRTFVETAQAVFEQEAGFMGSQLAFGALPYRPGEVMVPQFDTAALFALGWRPALPLREGLADTTRAFLSGN
ncbi:MAG: NAD(P)-dependent oxidoreductase [Halioglobus sp.]|nr:NAD(P)-dependent oxidoreductase [Halioglobus sp.]